MTIRVEKDGPVTTVIIDRREARNAVSPAMAQQLADAFAAFDADDTASVGVLYGAHGTFCAGFDLKWRPAPRASAGRRPTASGRWGRRA